MRQGSISALFLMISALTTFSHSLWYTLFPVYLRESGLEVWQAGLATSLTMTLSFVLAFPAGLAADSISTRASFLLASLGQLFTLLIMPIIGSPALLMLLLSIYTLSMTLRGQGALRFLSINSSPNLWGTTYSIYLLLIGVSSALGSYLAGYMAQQFSLKETFTVSAILFALSTPLALQFKGVQRNSSGRIPLLKPKFPKGPDFLNLTISLALHDFAVFSAMSYTQIFQREVVTLSPQQIGTLSALGTTISQAVQLIAGYFTDKLGAGKALILHYLGVSAGYALMGVSDSFEEMIAAVALQSLFLPFDMPGRRKMLSLMAPPDSVATVNGLSDAVVGLAALPSPLVGGYLWYSVGPRNMLLACALFNLTAFAPLALLKEGNTRN
ncbi:MAG: MFS transporter [Thermofilaceae archaeon]|nr:MFS transporter [Thermofilaceae archaeon]MCX8180151.1 MFS transporter [Thermofilaceae archaeon]MDW8004193.1 MFS transporter [Thermofilaceae archaeon]